MTRKNKGHEVGYKKPPKHTQFRKGQSGNPRGRPKGAQNLVSIINDLLDKPVTVVVEGVKQQMSGRNALAFKIFEKALKGDTRAIEILRETDREVAHQFLQEQEKEIDARSDTQSDKEILAHYLLSNASRSSQKKGCSNEK